MIELDLEQFILKIIVPRPPLSGQTMHRILMTDHYFSGGGGGGGAVMTKSERKMFAELKS